jgi:hypothetical protein
MTLLDPPILFTLELHLAINGRSRIWVTPRDLRALPAADRIAIAQTLEAQLDQLFGALGVTRRIEVTPLP